MASCAPTRCGSAPPCIEEAFASIQSSVLIKQQQKSSIDNSNARQSPSSESEEKLLSDPAYIAYYRAHVNLNPRLPPPVPSRERQNLGHNGAGFKSFLIRERLLPTCIEEHKQEQPTKGAHSFVGRSRSFVDLTQADVPSTSSAHPSSGLAIQRSNSFSAYENLENSIPPSSAAITKPVDHFQDEVPAHRAVKSDITGTETLLRALNISLSSAEGRAERKHDKVLLSDSRNYRHPDHQQVQRVQVTSSSHWSDYSYAVHPELSSSHASVLGVKPSVVNQVPIPALYASREAYMISGSNPLHHNLHRPGTLELQHNLGGYSLPFGYNSPYVVGHSMSFDPYLAGYIQFMNKVYGQHGLMPHPSFAGVLQGQFVQLPLKGGHVHPTHRSQWTGGIDNYCDPYSPLSSQRESSLAELMNNRNHTSGESGRLASSSSYTRGGCPGGGYDILSQGFNFRGEGNLGVQHSSHPQHSSGQFYSQARGPRSSCHVEEDTRNTFLEVQRSYWDGALELSHIAGRIVEFSADQHGSRFIQQKLESCSIQEKKSVFSEVIPHTIELTTDVFGNYVIQKLFEHGSVEQRKRLADQIAGKILNLSLQMYGCRVVQKAIEVIEVDQKVGLVHELEGNVIKCVLDQNGNHVIQKCIQCIPAREIGFIISSFHGEVTTLSKHPYGCRVIQRILEHCSNYQASKFIVHDVLEHASSLACDQYGNYVVQHVMEMGRPSERSHIIDQLYGRFVEMSQHKFASNVVEKCLKHGDESERKAVIHELIGNPEENAAPLLTMMKDQYANYVVQRILDVCVSERREAVVNCIQGNMDGLRKYTYGKHIVARYNKLSGGLADAGENTVSS